jgi:signal transduction histidine kinase
LRFVEAVYFAPLLRAKNRVLFRMYVAFTIVVAVSFVLQVLAAWQAVRLIRLAGASWAWIGVAAGLVVMAIRRASLLYYTFSYPGSVDHGELVSESFGLVSALLFFVGVMVIEPLFRSIRQARHAAEQSHDRLEFEIIRQNSELVAANQQLTNEVAKRTEAETALYEEHRHLRSVLEIYEQDRRLVAYDIHDGFVQTAAAAQMGLQAAIGAYKDDPDKSIELTVRSLEQLRQSLAQVRALMHGLRPVVLEESGLPAAIAQLVQDAEADSKVRVEWTSCVTFDRLSPALEMSIFRIVQEGLTNARRHSMSDRVSISMSQVDRMIHLRIEDYGIGFDPSEPKAGHFGLEGIRERARLLGGTARIESTPGNGTRIDVELPLVERN